MNTNRVLEQCAFKQCVLSICLLLSGGLLGMQDESKEKLLEGARVIEMESVVLSRVGIFLSERNRKDLNDNYEPCQIIAALAELEEDADYKAFIAPEAPGSDGSSVQEEGSKRQKAEQAFMLKALSLLAKNEQKRTSNMHRERHRDEWQSLLFVAFFGTELMLSAAFFPIIRTAICS